MLIKNKGKVQYIMGSNIFLTKYSVCAKIYNGDEEVINKIRIEHFKSIQSQEFELSQVNIFIGANGSGKSNILEAIGVLSAAANGTVNDSTLLQRGVRPGVPKLYKSAFEQRYAPNIFFSAADLNGRYSVALHNPLSDPRPAWRYKSEMWKYSGKIIVTRAPRKRGDLNLENGMAALRAVEISADDPALVFLRLLQEYVIYSPTTNVLRGIAIDTQPRNPIGLNGARLPEAILELQREIRGDHNLEKIHSNALELIDWASSYSSAPSVSIPLSPTASVARRVISFKDKYMRKGRNILSGYDASEGALYVLFLTVLAGHPQSPKFYAIDNADHGLNPILASKLFKNFCSWILDSQKKIQVLITSHNAAVLDGLPIQDERVRLFVVDRNNKGYTEVRPVMISEDMINKAREGWTLSRMWMNKLIGGVPNV